MNKEDFVKEVEKLGIEVNENKLERLDKYYKLLIEWNKKINLTAITEEKEVYLKHFYDSLTLYKAINLNEISTLCDVGTGAGFPGIVLKIFFENLEITLVDALNKRIIFLNEVIEKLNLKNIVAVHARAEEFANENIEKFDVVTSRAVAKLNILNEICIPMVKIDGYFIAMKANIEEELNDSKSSIIKLYSSLDNVISFNLPYDKGIRNLVRIKKNKSTNNIYPRKFDKISKNPL